MEGCYLLKLDVMESYSPKKVRPVEERVAEEDASSKLSAIKRGASKVEVTLVPTLARDRLDTEMLSYGVHDSLPDLLFLTGQLVLKRLLFAGFRRRDRRVVGHSDVGAENVDALLPSVVPVVGEACHGVDTREPVRNLVGGELVGSGCELLREQFRVFSCLCGLPKALFAVGDG
jgi:hypothetical protein